MSIFQTKKAALAVAISSALILSACGGGDNSGAPGGGNIGGGDGGGVTQPGGVIITAMDGYFLNAAVFVDRNNNGILDSTEAVLGLTDAKGQVKLTKEPEGTLAIQTIVPNGQIQQALIELDPAKYAGKYTVDMDHPSQPMEHEVVLRSPNKGEDKVTISPLTDLVMIHAGENPDAASIAAAEQKVATQLNIEDVYVNYIETENKELHKTAQILTETKATDSNYAEKVEEIVEEALTVVGDMTAEEVKDPDFKPVVDGDISTPPVVDYKTVVIEQTANAIQSELNTFNVDLQTSAPAEGISVSADITTLFQDKDIKNDAGEPMPFASTDMTLDATQLVAAGIEVKFENNQLVVSLAPNTKPTKAGVFNVEITLNAQDKVAETTAIFTVKVEKGVAKPPVADQAVIDSLQNEISAWNITQGEAFFGPLDYSTFQSIFESSVEVTFGTDARTNGLDFIYQGASRNLAKFGLAGIPLNAAAAGEYRIWIEGKADNGLAVLLTLELPKINTAPEVIPPPPEDNAPKFKPEHFEKGGVWRMGSFNAGDSEVGYASMRDTNGAFEFCWGSDASLSDDGWSHALSTLDQNKPANDAQLQCDPVALNEDGTIEYTNGQMGAFKLAYEHKVNGEYKLLFTVDRGLFWLDSAAENFEFSLSVPVVDGFEELTLSDDNTSREGIETMLAVSRFAANGTVEMFDADHPQDTLSATWETMTDGSGDSLMLSEQQDSGIVEREIFYVRDFGDVTVSIEDKHADDNHAAFTLKSQNETLLRAIKEAWQPGPPKPTTPATEFENKVWFTTEHGSNGEFNNSVTWCDSSYFANGIAYSNIRTSANRTTCSDYNADPSSFEVYGSYEVDGPYLKITVTNDSTGEAPETTQYSFAPVAAQIPGGKMVTAWGERYAYFTDKAAAERRLNAKSSDAPEIRDLPMELPNLESDTYSTGTMSARIRNGQFGFSIDQATGRSFTCEEFEEFYEAMHVTDGQNYISSTCQNSVSNNLTHASFSFHDTPETGVQYSFIARVRDHQQPLVEAIKYGLKN